MAVPYKLLKTNGRIAHSRAFRAVIKEHETVGLKRIARLIEKATAMTVADIVGTLDALTYELGEQLMQGNRVYLPGLGYFSLAVKGELYENPKTHKFRLRNPYVRTVNFRPEKADENAAGDKL